MSRYVPTHSSGPLHPPAHRVAVGLWYLPCVLLPLVAAITAPAWFLAVVEPQPDGVTAALEFLAASWTPWVLALLGPVALAVKYELARHRRGLSVADPWDSFALRWLGVTGAAGAVLTLVLAGVALSVTPA
jgi:hypothetical protein